MGTFDFLFGNNKKAQEKIKNADCAGRAVDKKQGPDAIDPAIVAAITAGVCEMLGTNNLAIRIIRTSNAWAAAGQQKLMDGRSFV